MSSYVPRLPLQLDPLIAEARRRARQRRLLLGVALLVVAAGVASPLRAAWTNGTANAAVTSSGRQCTPGTAYGSQCVDVQGTGRQVKEIQTWFDNTAILWPDLKWRIDLEQYNCNPIKRSKAGCPVAAAWHGRTRTGVHLVGGAYPSGVHFAQSRSNGYWATLALPHRFGSNTWLCTELSVFNKATGKWVYNAAGLPRGLRACVSVHR